MVLAQLNIIMVTSAYSPSIKVIQFFHAIFISAILF